MKIIIVPNSPLMTARHHRLASALAEQGHSVHYLMWAHPYAMKPADLLRHLFTSLIPKVHRHQHFVTHKAIRLPYFWPYINGWIFKAQITMLFRKLGADFVFTEGFTNEIEAPKSLPFIFDLADDYAAPAEVYGSRFYKLAFKLLDVRGVMRRQSQNALAVTGVSKALTDFARKYNANVYQLNNGVDTEIIQRFINDKQHMAKNKHSIIYVSGFGVWSRVTETMQTVKELRKEFPDIKLTLVGDGSETPKILDFIERNKAQDYIKYLGRVYDRERLFSLISDNAIGLNISDKNKWRDAAQPIKVLEYSALGKKVVSTDLNEVVALDFPNVHIFSDKPGGVPLKDALRSALNDARTEKDFGKVSKHVLKNYSWEESAKQIIEIFEKSKGKHA